MLLLGEFLLLLRSHRGPKLLLLLNLLGVEFLSLEVVQELLEFVVLILSGLLDLSGEFWSEGGPVDDQVQVVVENIVTEVLDGLDVGVGVAQCELEDESLARLQFCDLDRLFDGLVGDGEELEGGYAGLQQVGELLGKEHVIHVRDLVHEDELQRQFRGLRGLGQGEKVIFRAEGVHLVLRDDGPDKVVELLAGLLVEGELDGDEVLGRRDGVQEERHDELHGPHEKVLSGLQLDLGQNGLNSQSTRGIERVMLAVVLGVELLARDSDLKEVLLERRHDGVDELGGDLVVVTGPELEEHEIDEDNAQGEDLDFPVVCGESLEERQLAELLWRDVLQVGHCDGAGCAGCAGACLYSRVAPVLSQLSTPPGSHKDKQRPLEQLADGLGSLAVDAESGEWSGRWRGENSERSRGNVYIGVNREGRREGGREGWYVCTE